MLQRRTSAEEAEQFEEQLRAIVGRVLQCPPHPRPSTLGELRRGWRRGERPRAPPAPAYAERRLRDRQRSHLPLQRRCRSTTPYYREKHARRAKRRPGLYPALVVLGIYDRSTPKLASAASQLGRHAQLAGRSAICSSAWRRHRPRISRPSDSTALSNYAATGASGRSDARGDGLLDRVTGKLADRRGRSGPRPRAGSGTAWLRKTLKGRNRFRTDWKRYRSSSSCTSTATTGDRVRRGPRSCGGTHRGPQDDFALLLSYARQIGLNAARQACSSSLTARPGSGAASSASSPRSGSRRHRCWG